MVSGLKHRFSFVKIRNPPKMYVFVDGLSWLFVLFCLCIYIYFVQPQTNWLFCWFLLCIIGSTGERNARFVGFPGLVHVLSFVVDPFYDRQLSGRHDWQPLAFHRKRCWKFRNETHRSKFWAVDMPNSNNFLSFGRFFNKRDLSTNWPSPTTRTCYEFVACEIPILEFQWIVHIWDISIAGWYETCIELLASFHCTLWTMVFVL